jgi:tetratricopeptide (TPR) repeat protein
LRREFAQPPAREKPNPALEKSVAAFKVPDPMKFYLIPLLAYFGAISAYADFAELVKSGDVADAKYQSDEALKSYLPAEKLEPKNASLLVKISRQYVLKMNDLPQKAAKIATCRTGLAYAERAVAAAPSECDPHLSVAICLGKLTPYLSNRESIEASRQIKTSADKAVKFNPKNDYAWHILGRWHQALANIGGASRMLAGVIYGTLPTASNDTAVQCFQKAMALNPKRLIHVVELGRTYAMMGRKAEAKKYLEMGLAMPNKEKDDPETKQRARASLKEVS